MQKVKYDKKASQPNHLMGQDAGPPDCDNRQLVGPTGKGPTGLGNVLPALERKLKREAQPGI